MKFYNYWEIKIWGNYLQFQSGKVFFNYNRKGKKILRNREIYYKKVNK